MTIQQAFGLQPCGSLSADPGPTILYFATCPRLPSYDCACERFRCGESSTGAFPNWAWGVKLCSKHLLSSFDRYSDHLRGGPPVPFVVNIRSAP